MWAVLSLLGWSPIVPKSSSPTLLDVGSEEGDFTALFASWGCDVAYIDPSAPWIEQTIETLIANDRPVGVSFTGLADNHDNINLQTVKERRFATIDEDIARITLDTFCGLWGFKPDAVSMDVEGSEMRVLEGADKLLTDGAVWWISIHEDVNPHAETPSKVHWFMRSYGYQDQFLAYDHEWHYRFWR